jgi:hypothetical protein
LCNLNAESLHRSTVSEWQGDNRGGILRGLQKGAVVRCGQLLAAITER